MYNIFFVTEHSLKGYLLWFNLDWVLVYSFIAVNATFNNISVISQQSVLLVKESGEHHRQTLSYNVVSSTRRLSEAQTHNVSGDKHWWHR